MGVILEARGVAKTYHSGLFGTGRTVAALQGIDLRIERGSVFGLVGESGCGKTTLARILMGLERPTVGSIVFDGHVVESSTPRELRDLKRRMQIVFQDPNGALNPRLTVRTSLGEGLSNMGVRGTERRRRVDEAAERVGLPAGNLDRYPGEFSGGQRQRIVIARALTMDPDLLILDEPVSNLDVSIQAQIVNLLLDLRRELGLTYLFISHDLSLVSYVSDVVAVMYGGRIVEVAPVDSLLREPIHPYSKILLSAAPGTGKERRIEARRNRALKPSVRMSATGCPFAHRCPDVTAACGTWEPRLSDVGEGRQAACREIVSS